MLCPSIERRFKDKEPTLFKGREKIYHKDEQTKQPFWVQREDKDKKEKYRLC